MAPGLVARPRLIHALVRALREPGPALVFVRGPRGSGKSHLIRTAVGLVDPDRRVICLRGMSGPAPRHLRALQDALTGLVEPSTGGWDACVDLLIDDLASRREPRVVVLDEVHHLIEASDEVEQALRRLWVGVRARGLPLHLVIATADDDVADALTAEKGPLPGPGRTLVVGDVSLDELRDHLPEWAPRERFLAQACLGRSVARLRHLDPALRAATNLERLVVDPDGPLHDDPPRRLRERLQRPDRYAGVLAALAEGAQEWGSIRQANPAFTAGNQLAPYLSTLQELGWVAAHRSLDAAPNARRRHYRLTDPFVGFWYAVVEPNLGPLVAGMAPKRVWREHMADALDAYLARVFPHICRTVLGERGDDLLPVGARQLGGLWGDGYDLPIAGTLRNGAALYGHSVWGRLATGADADLTVRHMRATRFGFGRQARLRILVTSQGATEALVRRAARDELLTLIGSQAMF